MNETSHCLFLEGCVQALLRGQPLDGPAWPGATQSAGQVLLMLDLAAEMRRKGDEDFARWCEDESETMEAAR